jgi:hypothetical protein
MSPRFATNAFFPPQKNISKIRELREPTEILPGIGAQIRVTGDNMVSLSQVVDSFEMSPTDCFLSEIVNNRGHV